MLLQEFVEGEGTGYFALMHHGELCAEFAHSGIRELRLSFRHLLPRTYPGWLRTLLQAVTPVPGTYHDLFQWARPRPESADWLNSFARLLRGSVA